MTKNEIIEFLLSDAFFDTDTDSLELLTNPHAYALELPELVAAINSLELSERLELLTAFEYCPIHLCDTEICFDDAETGTTPDCAPFH